MISLQRQILKKSLLLSIIWFGILLMSFQCLSLCTDGNSVRLLPLLSAKTQNMIWDLSANISQFSFSGQIHANGSSFWLVAFSKNMLLFAVFAVVSILLGSVPYGYFQLIFLGIVHILYYEIYANLMSLGILSHRDFTIEFSDFKYFFAFLTFSICLILSLWLTEESSRNVSQKIKGQPAAFRSTYKSLMSLILKLYLPCAIIASAILSI